LQRVILIVEDEVLVRIALSAGLEDAGYRVLECDNVTQAMQTLRERTEIDLLVTDVHMPGEANGFDLVRRAQEIRPSLPIIVSSGLASEFPEDLDRTATVLRKPYSLEELLVRIEHILT
jgi:DNA-binding response OmpR family regulator